MKVRFKEDFNHCIKLGKKPKTEIIKKGTEKEIGKFAAENLIRLDVVEKV